MDRDSSALKPAQLLREHVNLLVDQSLPGPVLDLACGDGHNGVFVAEKGLAVTCCDKSPEALDRTGRLAERTGVVVRLWQADLERDNLNPFPEDAYGGILVFRYLHRPLFPCIKKALKEGGILIYETFTVEQPRYGKPRNPDYLLRPGELRAWFETWDVTYYFEGVLENPKRAVAQIVCRKQDAGKRYP